MGIILTVWNKQKDGFWWITLLKKKKQKQQPWTSMLKDKGLSLLTDIGILCGCVHHIQDKKPWLCFAGAAMKRYPTSKVRENQLRW